MLRSLFFLVKLKAYLLSCLVHIKITLRGYYVSRLITVKLCSSNDEFKNILKSEGGGNCELNRMSC